LHPSDSRAQRILDPLHQGHFAILWGRNIQRKTIRYVTQSKVVDRFQDSGARIFTGARLPPQHSRGEYDVDRAKSGDHAPHGGMQDKRAKAGIVTQEVVPIPQAKPRQEEKNNAYLE
jgi:hypothetical protein